MKSAQRDGVMEVGPFASSDKFYPAEDVNNQHQTSMIQPFPIDFAGKHESSWILVIGKA